MQHTNYKSGRNIENLLARFVHLDKNPLTESSKTKPEPNESNETEVENTIVITRQTTINSDTDNILEVFSEQPVNIVCDNSTFKSIDFDVYLKCLVHELRTPLSIISLGMNVLEKNCKKSQRGTINDVHDIIKYIENIFTNFAVIQDGNIALNAFEPFNIHQLIKNVESILRYAMIKHDIAFEYYIDDQIYPWIFADVHNIQHVLINIINNAIKYSIPTRTNKIILNIVLSDMKSETTTPKKTVNKKQTIEISICDSNDYILPHIKQRLFESFNSTSGSGLGLYICKQIIEMHGGTISHDYITVPQNVSVDTKKNADDPSPENKVIEIENIRYTKQKREKTSVQMDKVPQQITYEDSKHPDKFRNNATASNSPQQNTSSGNFTRSMDENDVNILLHNFHKNIGNKFEIVLTVDLCEDVKLQSNSNCFMADNVSSINNKSDNNSESQSSSSNHNKSTTDMKYQHNTTNQTQNTADIQNVSNTQNVLIRRKSFTQIEENQDFSNISKDKSRYNVMIVDDSILNRKMLYKLLKQIPIFHEVFTAVDGIDAIHKICKNMNSIDIILIDKYMPQMDGMMVTKLLRGINFDNLIFEITGMDHKNNKNEIFDKFSANYVFIKPFDAEKINQMVQFIQKYGVKIQPNKIISLSNDELSWK